VITSVDAFVAVTVKVAELPAAIAVGFALMVTVAAGLALTVTTALAEALLLVPVALAL
jgi:hypothetical protein